MGEREAPQPGNTVAFEAFGVRLAVAASDPELLSRARSYLPPAWRPCPPSTVERTFSLTAEETGGYALRRDGKILGGAKDVELDLALELLDSQLRIYLGRFAPDTIFVHAGVVADGSRAIVMPGLSFSGKTTLVAALVRAGATYYSDEFAVLDRRGFVHPYAKPLSIRNGGWAQTDHPVDSLGGTAGDGALPIGAIVVTRYRPGAQWEPQTRSAGAGAMALLANAVPAKERAAEVMQVVSRAARDAAVLESDRGEADEVAPLLLEAVTGQAT